MAWRVARSLDVLLEQINARYPTRNTASDGAIGDEDHQNRSSDHNPWYGPGIVTARDFTHDPANGVDIDQLTDELAASRDPRIKYVIANDLIMSGAGGPSPWTWREYHGTNLHTSHFHLSVVASPACDDTSPWNLPSLRIGGGGSAPPSQEDDMTPTESRMLRELHELWRKGNQTEGHPQPVGEGTGYVVEMLLRSRRQEAVAAGLQRAVDKLADAVGGKNLTAAELKAAVKAGTAEALEEGTVNVDIDVTGPEGKTA